MHHFPPARHQLRFRRCQAGMKVMQHNPARRESEARASFQIRRRRLHFLAFIRKAKKEISKKSCESCLEKRQVVLLNFEMPEIIPAIQGQCGNRSQHLSTLHLHSDRISGCEGGHIPHAPRPGRKNTPLIFPDKTPYPHHPSSPQAQ